jgi:ABC-type uncharacterized transport system involved in gliding motility auxiliary subunit
VIGQSELQVKQGYLGLAIQHGSETDAIPFVDHTDDLEYRLVSSIRNLTRAKKPALGFVTQPSMEQGAGYSQLQEQLGKSYDVRALVQTDSTQLDSTVAALVLAGAPDSVPADQLARLRRYIDHGGSLLVLAGGMAISPQAPLAAPRPLAWNRLLEPFGVSVRGDLAYDLVANEAIPLNSAFGRVLQPYPYFIRSESTRLSPVNQSVNDAVLTWASTIDTTKAAKGTVTPLLVTSASAGTFTDATSIDPRSDFPRAALGRKLLGAVVQPKQGKGRAVVIGSADFATDRFIQGAPENLALTLNAIDWLSQDEDLIGIRAKDRRPVTLTFASAAAREAAKYANLIGLPVLVALAGIVHLARRRRRTREPYRPLVAGEVAA